VTDATPPDPLLAIRHSYDRDTLDESRAALDPFVQFRAWIGDALAADLREPSAMTLATVDADGNPSARIVLLRGWDERGFTFFTNYVSAKGRDIERHPVAALVFFWDKLERQVRITGSVEKLAPDESDAYFALRPRGSRLSAWASPQSQTVPDRGTLDERIADAERRFEGVDVARPPHWGGYRVKPVRFEFWQGRPNRVHDRLAYTKRADAPKAASEWKRVRLGP
jgi:pyridoxamine 5'-phosphate oxidase